MHRLVFRAGALAGAIALLNSCALLAPFAPDANAKAPQLEGYGRSDVAITTASPEARALFNQGMLQAYAFNEKAAVRAFKAALAKDPGCAMCAWGVAWQLGPNINDHDRDNVPEALKYVDHALRHLDGATAREKALVQSLALRYAHTSTARETAPLVAARCGKAADDEDSIDPLDDAYAAAIRKLVEQYPADPDIVSLHAEAEIIATPGDAPWDKSGKPAGRMGEVVQKLELAVAEHPDHTGLNHYLVHALDATPVAARATAAADRLGRLAPQSPHLLHMPAHTYINIGRFDDATRVNQQAVAADVALAASEKAQGFEPSKDWRGHDLHFLWYAAMMAGREDIALDTATAIAKFSEGRDNNFGEYARSLRIVTLVRFERWDAVLHEPVATGEKGVAKLFWLHARGIAQARLGRADEAAASLEQLRPVAATLRETYAKRKRTVAMAGYTVERLESEIALARGDLDAAIAAQSRAVVASANLDDAEPPMMADTARVILAGLQVRAKRWGDAEATYRLALAERPGHPQAQRGLRELPSVR